MTIQVIACQDGTFDVGRILPNSLLTPLHNVPNLYSAVCDARLMQQAHSGPIEIVVGPYRALLQ